MALEALVRPFQDPGALVSRRIVPVREEVEVTPAGKRWGQPGQMPVAQQRETEETGFSFTVTHLNDAQEVKADRKSTDIRLEIQEPDGDKPYVIIRRTDKARFDYAKPRTYPSYEEKSWSQPASDRGAQTGVRPLDGPPEYFTDGNPTEVPISGAPFVPVKDEGIVLTFDNAGE